MAGEWQRYAVKALIDNEILLIGDGYRAKNQELASSGLPFARAGNINNGFRFDDADCFPEVHIARVGNKISQPGDVVFTSKGTVGRFAFVRPDAPRFVYSPQLCFWRSLNTDVIEPRFLYYWMHGREFFIQFKGVAGQTDMAEYVSLSDQRRMHISLPPIAEQRAIAHILGTLDDKIELNRKQNETLEAMARALFKAWFVDFEPVRAKMEGRWQRGQSLPGLPAHLYDLFPDRLVESELGEIPEGWRVGRFSDVVDIIGGGTPRTSVAEYWGGEIPWFSVVDTPTGSDVFVVQTEKTITQAGLSESSARLIPKGTTIISARGTVGNLAIAGCDMTFNQSCYALKGKDGYGNYFVFLAAQHMVQQLKVLTPK